MKDQCFCGKKRQRFGAWTGLRLQLQAVDIGFLASEQSGIDVVGCKARWPRREHESASRADVPGLFYGVEHELAPVSLSLVLPVYHQIFKPDVVARGQPGHCQREHGHRSGAVWGTGCEQVSVRASQQCSQRVVVQSPRPGGEILQQAVDLPAQFRR